MFVQGIIKESVGQPTIAPIPIVDVVAGSRLDSSPRRKNSVVAELRKRRAADSSKKQES